MMRRIGHVLGRWAIVATAVICLSFMIYGAGQQILRQGANSPQIAMAEDAAAALASGQPYESILPAQRVAFDQSLTSFLIVFDADGKPVASSAYLVGGVPTPPDGVFEYARTRGQDRVTWEPLPGVRIAAVVQAYGGAQPGFVLAGRSLREVERIADRLLLLVFAGGLFTLAVTLAAAILVEIIGFALYKPR